MFEVQCGLTTGMVETPLFPKWELLAPTFCLLPSNGYSQWRLTEFCPAQIQLDAWPSILFCRFLKVSLNSNLFPRSLPMNCLPADCGQTAAPWASPGVYRRAMGEVAEHRAQCLASLTASLTVPHYLCLMRGKPRCFNSFSSSLSVAEGLNPRSTVRGAHSYITLLIRTPLRSPR